MAIAEFIFRRHRHRRQCHFRLGRHRRHHRQLEYGLRHRGHHVDGVLLLIFR